VADVLQWFPEVEPVLIRRGFTALRQPLLRRTLAQQVTIARAATLRGIAAEELIEALNAAIAPRPEVPEQLVTIRPTHLTGAMR
jgi:hypothetical protein